jgi:hypothetical protein
LIDIHILKYPHPNNGSTKTIAFLYTKNIVFAFIKIFSQSYTFILLLYFNDNFEMRSSPINNIRNHRDYISSPYESAVRSRSPPRDPNISPDRFNNATEAEYWRQRAKSL